MKLSCAILILLLSLTSFAKDEIIYSIEHRLPMTNEESSEPLKKNYYINMGTTQGIKKGAVLDVFRTITQHNQYKQSQEKYKIKIGELKIIEITQSASIAIANNFYQGDNFPILEVKNFMIGDEVGVKTDN